MYFSPRGYCLLLLAKTAQAELACCNGLCLCVCVSFPCEACLLAQEERGIDTFVARIPKCTLSMTLVLFLRIEDASYAQQPSGRLSM